MKRTEIDYNKTYYNSKGKPFKIIKEVEPNIGKNGRVYRKVVIRFESGYETETCLSNLCKKIIRVADNLSPTVYGVGCLGYATYTNNEKMYNIWSDMLYRCYCESSDHYAMYGAKGVTVCERWKRFDYFLEDVVKLSGYQNMIDNPHTHYQLDKDTLQQGVPANRKIYSPETCTWIPAFENTIQSAIDNKNKYKSKYYGVYPSHGGNGYVARIKVNNKDELLGTYDSEEAAANAYNYFAIGLGRPALNNVPPMSRLEVASHLLRPLQMLVDDNRTYGVTQLKSGNYQVVLCNNGNHIRLGVYTNLNAALNIYNYFAELVGKPNINKVPFMSPAECRQYMVNPRQMCSIVQHNIESLPIHNQSVNIQIHPTSITLKEMCTIIN